MVTYFISLILSIVFESPIVALEKLITRGSGTTSDSPKYSCSTSSMTSFKSKASTIKRSIDLRNNNDNCEINKYNLNVPA